MVAEYFEEMFDQTGEAVDIETETSLWACDVERSIIFGHDHWQAGFSGTVTLYAEEALYRQAVETGKRRIEEMSAYDDGDPG